MVLILAAENDQVTNDVIEELILLNKSYLRLSAYDKISIVSVLFDGPSKEWTISFTLNSDERIYSLSEFDAFWYRKGFLKIDSTAIIPQKASSLGSAFHRFILSEIQSIEELFVSILEKKRFLGNYFQSTPNKLRVLEAALAVGLQVPVTMITSTRANLVQFHSEVGDIICKSIQDILSVQNENKIHFTRTEEVSSRVIASLPETFPPSLFQQKIEKRFEVRTFYFNDDFYSMAIFSQENPKTKVDFRNYDWNNPNRNIPFTLPDSIEKKLKALFALLKLNTGSVDLLYSTESDYFFLEVNPVGQFGIVSYECNYNLENKIAAFLADHSS